MHVEIQSVFSCSQILETTRVQDREAETTNREHFLENAPLLPARPVLVASRFLSHGEVIFYIILYYIFTKTVSILSCNLSFPISLSSLPFYLSRSQSFSVETGVWL